MTINESCYISFHAGGNQSEQVEFYELTAFKGDQCEEDEQVSIKFSDGAENELGTVYMSFAELESFIVSAKVFLSSAKLMNESDTVSL